MPVSLPPASESIALTRGVRVRVRARFVQERSDPEHRRFFFAYHVTISNEGDEPVKLVSRRWIIKDGSGRTQVVEGPGVVGEQPRLGPGESFEYTSACPLRTELGSMRGVYQMVTDEGEEFDAEIAPFTLVCPTLLN